MEKLLKEITKAYPSEWILDEEAEMIYNNDGYYDKGDDYSIDTDKYGRYWLQSSSMNNVFKSAEYLIEGLKELYKQDQKNNNMKFKASIIECTRVINKGYEKKQINCYVKAVAENILVDVERNNKWYVYIDKLRDSDAEHEIAVKFSVKHWQDKQFQNIKLIDIVGESTESYEDPHIKNMMYKSAEELLGNTTKITPDAIMPPTKVQSVIDGIDENGELPF